MKYITVTSRCAAQYRNDKLEEYGLRGSQYAYILNVCRSPGVSQEALSKLVCINKSNVARQLAQLEEDGFIERGPSESDKRITLVYPTEKARRVYPAVVDVLREWSGYLTGGFTEAERETLSGMLEKVALRATEYLDKNVREE